MILYILAMLICVIIIAVLLNAALFYYDILKKEYNQKQKLSRNFKLINRWFEKKIENDDFIIEYLNDKGYRSVAIYGFGYIGELLYKDLRHFDVSVNYIIDNAAKNKDIRIFSLKDDLPKTDVIVVAVSYDYENIETRIKSKVNVPVVFLEEMLQ